MSPAMHSPISSDDDLNLNVIDDSGQEDDDPESCRASSSSQTRKHRKHKHHKDRKHRRKKHKLHSSSEHSSLPRHRKHKKKKHKNRSDVESSSHYDFEPKPQIISSKPLVHYDDVSENEDIMDDNVY